MDVGNLITTLTLNVEICVDLTSIFDLTFKIGIDLWPFEQASS